MKIILLYTVLLLQLIQKSQAQTRDSLPGSVRPASRDSVAEMTGVTMRSTLTRTRDSLPGPLRPVSRDSVGEMAGATLRSTLTRTRDSLPGSVRPVSRDSVGEMAGVTVRSTRPLFEHSPGGITVNVEQSLFSKGSSLLELLERAPGITIDHRNQSIALQGRSGVLVILDGQVLRLTGDQVLTLLASLPANEVATIELLTTPPAGFDAEGSAGVIRITLKKRKRLGTSGSANLVAGQGWGPKTGFTLQLARNIRKIQLSGSYTYNLDRTYSDLQIEGYNNMPVLGGRLHVSVHDTSKATQQNHNFQMTAQFLPDTNTTWGIQGMAGISNRNMLITDRSDFTVFPDSLLFFGSRLSGNNRWNNQSVGIFLDKRLKKERELSIRSDYLRFYNNNPTQIDNYMNDKWGRPLKGNDTLFAPLQRGRAGTRIEVATAKADMTDRLSDKIIWNTGLKVTSAASRSQSTLESLLNHEWIPRNGTSNDIRMNEQILAVYLTFAYTLAGKYSLTLGSRYEYARTEIRNEVITENNQVRRMGRFFPSVVFTRKISKGREVQLSYSERISRPSYNDLASYVRYADATAVYTGNPLLKPGLSRNIRAGLVTARSGLTLIYNHDRNAIANYQLTASPAGNLLFVSPQNVTWIRSLQLQWDFNQLLTSWWQVSGAVSGGWKKFRIDYTLKPVDHEFWSYSLSASNNITLPANTGIELSGWFSPLSYNGTVRGYAAGSLNLAFRKDLKRDRGRLILSITDLLRTQQYVSSFGTLTTEVFEIRNRVVYNAESRVRPVIRLTYSRSLGLLNTKNVKSREQADEAGRIRSE
ncbi:MAG: TonB-dependent receptor [Chitinophagaceae bacterium]